MQEERTYAAAPAEATAVPEPPAGGPPPERYATLPPGAIDGDGDVGAGSATEGNSPNAPPADPGLLPNAGSYSLTGVRVGMSTAEVYGRYPADSGWDYDSSLAANSEAGRETGVIMAKPRDYRARASEMFYLDQGEVVAFLRAVQENGAAFNATAAELQQQYGKGAEAPPQWARGSTLLRSWRSTANEVAQFWGDPRKRQVLTAGHSPTGSETVYMLFDVDRVELVQQALAASPGTEALPEPDRSWNLPPASGS
jgi:hypothetical protein